MASCNQITMAKTALEWFKELPEPYSHLVISYTHLQECSDNLYINVNLMSRAILLGFRWDQTPEGEDFWTNFYDDLKKQNK